MSLDLSEIIAKARIHLAKSEMREAFRTIESFVPKEQEDSFISLKAALSANEKNMVMGVVTREDYNLQTRRIMASLLSILQDMLREEQPREKQPDVETRERPQASANYTVLFINSLPYNETPINVGAEVANITHSLKSSGVPHTLITEFDVDIEDLAKIIRNANPHVVHIASHGKEGLVFSNRNGVATKISVELLVGHFSLLQRTTPNIECVVLNACESQDHARAILPYVKKSTIGTIAEIPDPVSTSFARGFYEIAGPGVDYGLCFISGLLAIETDKHRQSPALPEYKTIPVIFTK